MELVDKRDRETLLPIIEEHTLPGTIIHSDCWTAYSRVAELATVAQHGTVNHSRHFVDPQTGFHTQAIESYWARAKAKLKRIRETRQTLLPSYIDEFMWRERYGRNEKRKFDENVALRNVWRPCQSNIPLRGTHEDP